MTLPNKLKKDGLLEVACEVRFDSPEIAEIIIGRLSVMPLFKGLKSQRTAIADIPAPIRDSTPDLKYQPQMIFLDEEKKLSYRVGSNVLVFSCEGNYPGWASFYESADKFISTALEAVGPCVIKRAGIRYVNGLTPSDHLIGGVKDLDMSIVAASHKLEERVNLNYIKTGSPNHEITIRISSPELVTGLPDNAKVLIDLDVYTIKEGSISDHSAFKGWLEQAHDIEKKEFFGLLPNEVLTQIVEN